MTRLEDLSPEQQEVATRFGQGMAVMAGAGSGKTTTLVVKCEELLKRNPKARFAAVSFTERSAADIRDKLSRRVSLQGEGGALSGHWVMTIHGLCAAVLHEFPREAGFTGEERMLSGSEGEMLWQRACDGLWFDELPADVAAALELLLSRESRDEIRKLLLRGRDLEAFGVLDRLAESGDPFSQALSILARFGIERYDRMKRRRGAMDFSDLEAGAERALKKEAVAESFRKRFDLVLVDEFQDTNPVQARIMLRFCKSDRSNLCVVGDPKQSIYRFRDADVSVFEDFCARMPVRLSLTRNYRSRPGILKFTNQVCEPAFEASKMVYEPLVPQREAQEPQPVTRLSAKGPDDLARHIREQVQAGVPLDKMALLMRKIRGNEKWFKALTAAGIPLALGSGGLFWEDPRVRELVALLRWWDNPANALSGAVVLRSPWVGVPDLEIERWLKEDPTLERPFFRSDLPLAKMLAPLRGRPVRPGDLLVRLMDLGGSPRIEEELGAPVLGLWHRCEELSVRGMDFHAVVLEVSRAIDESRRERDVPPPRNQGQLPVLTLHSAKGLEFDHVFLIDFGVRGRAAAAPLLFWDRERGAFLGGRDSDGERLKKDPVEVEWRELEASKNLAESKRVFYVALTRARETLTLVWPELESAPKVAPTPEALYLKDGWRGWVEASGAVPEEKPAASQVSQDLAAVAQPESSSLLSRRARAERWVRPRHGVTEWNLLARCERAYEWTYIRPRLAELLPQSDSSTIGATPKRGLDPRSLGNAVHRGLETGNFEALQQIESQSDGIFQAAPLIDWVKTSAWMQLEEGARAWNELGFEASVGGEILVGSIDRLVRGADGTYTILDYKVTARAKSREEILEAYSTQVALYAEGVRSLLGQTFGAKDLANVSAPAPRIRCVLVAISPSGVTEFEAPVPEPGLGVSSGLAQKASEIIAGRAGKPSPGPRCRHCGFSGGCSSSGGAGGVSSSGGAGGISSGGAF